jgi:NAD(P)-dependent dehydrogenase (short-subunit alcohol dehydrogenase family)
MNSVQFDLSGRVALVSGASSGLGAHFAKILAASGAAVVLAARRVERLEAVKAEILRDGGRAIAVALDVCDQASTIAAYEAAEASFGTIDTVIANAGVNAEGLVLDLPVEAFQQVMDVNVTGVFLTIREGARRLLSAGIGSRGRIVIVSSINAQAVTPGVGAYSASKAAVLQLGRVCAREWARAGISVNILCPGYIDTDITRDWFATDGGRKQLSKFPRRRLMAKDDLDAMLLYLSSDACGATTGSAVTIDDAQAL